MSRIFGEMRQVAYVVRDLHAAMRRFVAQGIGPFFWRDPAPMENFFHGGLPSAPVITVAMGQSGAVQIEIVQQLNDAPSMFHDFIAAGREGMQHWSSWPGDYDAAYARAVAAGFKVGHEGRGARGRFVYFRDRDDPLLAIEMAEPTAERQRLNAAVRAASVGWDGAEPIRHGYPV